MIYVFLADGFEETEAEMMLPSIHDALEIKRSNGKRRRGWPKSFPARPRSANCR